MEQAAQGPFAATRTGEQTDQSGRKRDTAMRDGVGKTEKEKVCTKESSVLAYSRGPATHALAFGFSGIPVLFFFSCTFLKAKAAFKLNHALVSFCWLQLKA